MLKPAEWNAVLAPNMSWDICYPVIAEEARKILMRLPAGTHLSTKELTDALYPSQFAKQSDVGAAARFRIMRKALTKARLGTHELADCMTLGSPRPHPIYKRRTIQPCRWHAPKEDAHDW
jgi:hypothetical protein